MTQTHPITPPPELVQQWIKEPQYITEDQLGKRMNLISMNEIKFREIIDKISQYSADQELEASLEWLEQEGYLDARRSLRNARRKPPSLKDQPVAEGPSDEEIEEWADACPEAPLEEMDPEVHGWRRCFTAKEFSETIRAALARWGHQ